MINNLTLETMCFSIPAGPENKKGILNYADH